MSMFGCKAKGVHEVQNSKYKSPDLDGIHSRLLKDFKYEITDLLAIIWNLSLNSILESSQCGSNYKK